MLLKLGLPKGKVVWALAHPVSREYIHQESGIGYQECSLIVTQGKSPVEVKLQDYPNWAQKMIISSLRAGELINTGDQLFQSTAEETIEDLTPLEKTLEQPKTKPRKGKTLKKLKNE
jgi:hypothetical protein